MQTFKFSVQPWSSLNIQDYQQVPTFFPSAVILHLFLFSGLASMSIPVYIAECSPSGKRGSLVTIYQVLITFGLFASCVVCGLLANVREGWRYSFVAYFPQRTFIQSCKRAVVLPGICSALLPYLQLSSSSVSYLCQKVLGGLFQCEGKVLESPLISRSEVRFPQQLSRKARLPQIAILSMSQGGRFERWFQFSIVRSTQHCLIALTSDALALLQRVIM